MAISVFDLFKSGIGPSSSHTVGPMVAANRFVRALVESDAAGRATRIKVELFGSLGATGKGHGSDKAVLLGLEGEHPRTVDVDTVDARLERIRGTRSLTLPDGRALAFDEAKDLVMHRRRALPFHPNAMTFRALDADGDEVSCRSYYSVGGGFVLDDADAGELATTPPPTSRNVRAEDAIEAAHDAEDRTGHPNADASEASDGPADDVASGPVAVGSPSPDAVVKADDTPVAHPFASGDELLERCREHGLSIASLMLANELAWRDEAAVRAELLELWHVMEGCVARGCATRGTLPGGMRVKRRAADLHDALAKHPEAALRDPLTVMDWVNLYALAVNEENAAGGRVVTAPTNGAAGIIPAVLHYYVRFVPGSSDAGVVDFLLTAGAIGILYKENASISGAEVGCQGEVGSACSMAAGALAAVMGGTPEQVENAAEIGMEHNLGLTCDPVGGLVQVPCIERNAMGAVKAINAARIAMRGDGTHCVSLDKVIKTMRETGADMKTKYKETARGGLALNVIEVPVSRPDC